MCVLLPLAVLYLFEMPSARREPLANHIYAGTNPGIALVHTIERIFPLVLAQGALISRLPHTFVFIPCQAERLRPLAARLRSSLCNFLCGLGRSFYQGLD